MKQFRVVYEYDRGLVKGAGAAFVIALDEAGAREQIARVMPGVIITFIREEQEDPRAQYERRPKLDYPAGWAMCPGCGKPALDGHITCGDVLCNEGGRR
jgi:hypothetical protein